MVVFVCRKHKQIFREASSSQHQSYIQLVFWYCQVNHYKLNKPSGRLWQQHDLGRGGGTSWTVGATLQQLFLSCWMWLSSYLLYILITADQKGCEDFPFFFFCYEWFCFCVKPLKFHPSSVAVCRTHTKLEVFSMSCPPLFFLAKFSSLI